MRSYNWELTARGSGGTEKPDVVAQEEIVSAVEKALMKLGIPVGQEVVYLEKIEVTINPQKIVVHMNQPPPLPPWRGLPGNS